jgi:hypothetical protein
MCFTVEHGVVQCTASMQQDAVMGGNGLGPNRRLLGKVCVRLWLHMPATSYHSMIAGCRFE